MTQIIDQIFALFARFGSGLYGEDLSLERHMLQTAGLAEANGAPRETIVAALLHDIGHFLHAESDTAVSAGRDLEHETLGAAWLEPEFDVSVTAPIALHVAAKRYLCAVEPEYFAALSPASRLSLAVQGGPMNAREIGAFKLQPAFAAAVFLRRCDDAGKDAAVRTRDLNSYRELLIANLRQA